MRERLHLTSVSLMVASTLSRSCSISEMRLSAAFVSRLEDVTVLSKSDSVSRVRWASPEMDSCKMNEIIGAGRIDGLFRGGQGNGMMNS